MTVGKKDRKTRLTVLVALGANLLIAAAKAGAPEPWPGRPRCSPGRRTRWPTA